MMADKIYISGVTKALVDTGVCDVDDFIGVVEKVAAEMGIQDPAAAQGAPPPQDPGADPQGGATPEQLQQVAGSGLTDKDIESAAKVVQVLAEMKQTADQMGMGADGQGAAQSAMSPMPQQQQVPLPQPPQPPQGMPSLGGAGMQQKMAALLESETPESRTLSAINSIRKKLR